MAVFNYVATNDKGQKIKDQIEAKDRNSAIDVLRKNQLVIISIDEVSLRGKGLFQKRSPVKLADLVVFTRQLFALVKAGVPLVRGLSILAAQIENKTLKGIITSVTRKIESGSSLSDAMADYPDVFPPLYLNMIKAGEFSGALDNILERLAIHLESSASLNRKVRSALAYPTVVIIVAILLTAVIFIKVIPGFKSIFEGLGSQLPLPTQIVIAISDIFRKYFVIFVIAIVALLVVLKRATRIPAFRLAKDKLELDLPIIGRIIRKVVIARFSRTLSTLLNSGVSILPALDIGSKTSGNMVVEQSLNKVTSRVSKGEKIWESLAEDKIFAPLVISLIAIGEETGDIGSMLEKIAVFYEDEVNTALASLTSMLEPLIIVFLGVVVGGIVISMFLPILKLTQIIGR